MHTDDHLEDQGDGWWWNWLRIMPSDGLWNWCETFGVSYHI